MKKAVHQGKYLESEKAIEANGAIRDVAEACGYGKATAVRVSSYRPLVCKRLVRCRYEYTPNTGNCEQNIMQLELSDKMPTAGATFMKSLGRLSKIITT